MYKIGICDDDQVFAIQIEKFLLSYAHENGIIIDIELFFSGEAYIQFMEQEPPLDILFLDIELGRTDGVSIGQRIRKDLINELTQIVYVSSKQGYAMSLFQNRPMDFILKPVCQKDIDRIMREYRRVYDSKNRFFEFHIGKTDYRIAISSIVYFQCVGKKICIEVNDGNKREFYGAMREIEQGLDKSVFCKIHKSFIVNIGYVSEFCVNEVVMATGEVFPISQSMRKKVRQWILETNLIGQIERHNHGDESL